MLVVVFGLGLHCCAYRLSGLSFLGLFVVSWAGGGVSSSEGVFLFSRSLSVVQGLTPVLGLACCDSRESQCRGQFWNPGLFG